MYTTENTEKPWWRFGGKNALFMEFPDIFWLLKMMVSEVKSSEYEPASLLKYYVIKTIFWRVLINSNY